MQRGTRWLSCGVARGELTRSVVDRASLRLYGCNGSRAPIDALNKRKFGGSPRPDTFNVSSTPDTGHWGGAVGAACMTATWPKAWVQRAPMVDSNRCRAAADAPVPKDGNGSASRSSVTRWSRRRSTGLPSNSGI